MDYEATADKYTGATGDERLLIRMTRSMFIAELQTAERNAAVAPAERQTLSEQERHAVEHARFQADRATSDDPECCFDFELVKTLVQIIDRRSPAVGGKKLHKSMWQQPEYDPELSLLGAVKEMAAPQDGPECPSQPECDIQEAINAIPVGLNWLAGKGKTRPDEPAFGVQLLRNLRVVAEAEDDDLCSAIRKAIAALPSTNKTSSEPWSMEKALTDEDAKRVNAILSPQKRN